LDQGVNGDLWDASRQPAPTRVCCRDDASLRVSHKERHAVRGLDRHHQLGVVGDEDIGLGQLGRVMAGAGPLDNDSCAVDLVKARKLRG
jgi:hypothetical protein